MENYIRAVIAISPLQEKNEKYLLVAFCVFIGDRLIIRTTFMQSMVEEMIFLNFCT